jgi:hypothetical protein
VNYWRYPLILIWLVVMAYIVAAVIAALTGY